MSMSRRIIRMRRRLGQVIPLVSALPLPNELPPGSE
jgi:hypothetical protein